VTHRGTESNHSKHHNFSCGHPQPSRLARKVADSGHYGNCGLAELCVLIPVHGRKGRVRGPRPFPGHEKEKMMHALATQPLHGARSNFQSA